MWLRRPGQHAASSLWSRRESRPGGSGDDAQEACQELFGCQEACQEACQGCQESCWACQKACQEALSSDLSEGGLPGGLGQQF